MEKLQPPPLYLLMVLPLLMMLIQ